jgi:hypothetical protein
MVAGSSLNERMRIDSSGNLLVGTTTIGVYNGTTSGFAATGAGYIFAGKTNDAPMYLNRIASDGHIAVFSKDGSTVGSIGVATGDPYFASANGAGLKLRTADCFPVTTTGTAQDAAIDLGLSNARFKDLYLSGGVYLGGTGSANHLDDYEEGTFSPTYVPQTGSFTSITYDAENVGSYTKIGDTVICFVRIRTDAITVGTASGSLNIGNLPFTSSSSYETGMALSFTSDWGSNPPVMGFLINSTTSVLLASGSGSYTQVSDLATGSNDNQIMCVITYKV